MTACGEVPGGAVELSWSLESPTGGRVSCETAGVGRVKLWWKIGATTRYESWPCDVASAVTRYSVSPGEVLLWVEPECIDGSIPSTDTYEAPAPLLRTLEAGDVVTLNGVLITVQYDCKKYNPCLCPAMARRSTE